MVWLSHFFPKSRRNWCLVKNSLAVKRIRTIMTDSSYKAKAVEEKLQSHGVWLFTSSISDMGQTSPTCQVWHHAFTAKQQTDQTCIAGDFLTSTASVAWLQMKLQNENENESWTTDRNICVVQLVFRSMRSSSAPWKRQMFAGARGYKRSIGLAIWRWMEGFSLFPQAHKEPIHQHGARSGA